MTTIWSPLLRRLRQWSRSSRGRTRKLEGMEYSNSKTPCRDQPNNSSDRISSSDSQVNYESRVGENTLPSCNGEEEVQEPPTQNTTEPESSVGYQRLKGKKDNMASSLTALDIGSGY